VIDLRSDTMTRPSPAMRAAMAAAEVGDEQWGEDPTVTALERRVAALLGQEAAVYLPTATMANQIAAAIQTRPGQELIVEETAHMVIAELGGAARHSGLQLRMLRGERGTLAPEQVRAAAHVAGHLHTPNTGLVALENTHNTAGGAVWPLDLLDATVAAAHELGVPVHLDGARLMNASVALGVPAARIASQFDTVTLCLSKGLGCPMGALIAGSSNLMARGRREKHAFGGALRQAGIVAAAGLYALDHLVERLADDHARAGRLAEGLRAAGLDALAETNFVRVVVAPLDEGEAIERLAAAGVGLSGTAVPGVLRAVTHLDISDEDVERAIEVVPVALGLRERARA
jgi:threonine aldolase